MKENKGCGSLIYQEGDAPIVCPDVYCGDKDSFSGKIHLCSKCPSSEPEENNNSVPSKLPGFPVKSPEWNLGDKEFDVYINEAKTEWHFHYEHVKEKIQTAQRKLKEKQFCNTCECSSCKNRPWIIDVKDIDKVFLEEFGGLADE